MEQKRGRIIEFLEYTIFAKFYNADHIMVSDSRLHQIILETFENNFRINSDEKSWGQNYIFKVKPFKIGSSIMRDVIIVHA